MPTVLPQEPEGFGKRVGAGQERGTLGGYSKQTLDQMKLGENVALICSFDLSLAYHMHRFVPALATNSVCGGAGQNQAIRRHVDKVLSSPSCLLSKAITYSPDHQTLEFIAVGLALVTIAARCLKPIGFRACLGNGTRD